MFLSGGSRGNPFPCLFQLLDATHIPWFAPPFEVFKASRDELNLSLVAISLILCSWEAFSALRIHVIRLGSFR